MRRNTNIRRGGFTLVEMLVVIAIIAILAAILVPVVGRVMRRSRQTRIAAEVMQLEQAIAKYKQDFHDLPPDGTDVALVQRHLRARFPRHKETPQTLQELANAQLTPAESLVFWLSQVLDDYRLPLTGSGEPKQVFPFDETRLVPTRQVTIGGVNVQLYAYLPQDSDVPYVYFDSRTYSSASYTDPSTSELVLPYQFQIPDSNKPADWANKDSYQLISAGLDGYYGETQANTYKVFPIGTNYTAEDLDNITNFNDGRPLNDNPGYER